MLTGERRTYSDRAHTHDHSYAQLILPLQGALWIATDSDPFSLDESSGFFLPARCQHTFHARQTNEFLVLDIPNSLVLQAGLQHHPGGLRLTLQEPWHSLQRLLLSEVDQHPAGSDRLLHLWHYTCHLLVEAHQPRSLRYIQTHYHQPLEVRQLAQMEGYSFTYYCDWFKALTGKTPKAYLQDVRLDQAKALLEHTDLPIFAIAQQVGFAQASSLSRLFQRREGRSPAVYRTQIRNSAQPHPKFG